VRSAGHEPFRPSSFERNSRRATVAELFPYPGQIPHTRPDIAE